MAANPLEKAIKSGVRANDTIGKLFARVGTSEHPRGVVVSAYRNSNRALKSALSEDQPLRGVDDVMSELCRTIASDTKALLTEAQGLGREEAARQLSIYGVKTQLPNYQTNDELEEQHAVVEMVTSRIGVQEAAIRAMILTGAEPVQILGNDNRVGIVRSSDIAPQLAAWTATLLWSSFASVVFSYQRNDPISLQFSKQLISALDSRTTNCCILAHGQIAKLDKPFVLKGTPRFADQMEWPGFHHWCRSAGVLYLEEFDDRLTVKLRADAARLLEERG